MNETPKTTTKVHTMEHGWNELGRQGADDVRGSVGERLRAWLLSDASLPMQIACVVIVAVLAVLPAVL